MEAEELTFEKPDTETFYGLKLAYQALKQGGNMPTIFNAANENAVPLFMKGKIAYLDIPALVQDCMEKIAFRENPSLDDVLETEAEVNDYVKGKIR